MSSSQVSEWWHKFSIEDLEHDTVTCEGCGLVLSCKATDAEWQRNLTEPCRMKKIKHRLLHGSTGANR